MNQKYLFALLVFFFLTHVEKTYGLCGSGYCYPDGNGCGPVPKSGGYDPCGAKVIDANFLPGSILNITVSSPASPTGFGHFVISTDNKQFHRFLKGSVYVNGGDCEVSDGKDNPFISNWKYNFPTPPGGTWFDIWISVYWHCHGGSNLNCGVDCTSEDIHYRGYVH